jgi:hypothetical protein
VPVTVLPRPPPGSISHPRQDRFETQLPRPECSGTHQTRLRCVFRREGVCVDRSAINLDTSTESRSPEQTYGRFSFRGPSRLARKMAVREPRLTCTFTRVKTYPKGSGHFSATTRRSLAPRRLSNDSVRFILKLTSSSLSIGATDGAAISRIHLASSTNSSIDGAQLLRWILLRQNFSCLEFLRGHS